MKTQEVVGRSTNYGTIEELITKGNLMQAQGATHYNIHYDCDRNFGSVRIDWLKVLTEEEIKEIQIKELEEKLSRLKGQ